MKAPLRAMVAVEIGVCDLVSSRGEFAAEIDLERVAGIVMHQNLQWTPTGRANSFANWGYMARHLLIVYERPA